ncbi:MAG TPA: 2OG-Fe(II) oxygenase [Marinagarivorans sp.]
MVDQYTEMLPFQKLKDMAPNLAKEFGSAKPWPHVVIDDLFDPTILDRILTEFDDVEADWKTFKSKYEGKGQMNRDENFGPVSRSFFHSLNSAPFVEFLSEVSGIGRLTSDPYFVGGGYHQIPRGGKLGVHIDFNKHQQLGLYRRLNAILYLNKNWEEAYGGHFQLWDEKSGRCEKKVAPKFNRLAIFETTNDSFHGHPEPLTPPEGLFRRSLALYYYSPDRGNQVKREHSTIFLDANGRREELSAKTSFISRLKNKVLG